MKVCYFLFSAQFKITDGRYDFYIWDNGVENHVKPHLVVAGSRASMGHVVGPYIFCIVSNGCRLAYALCTYRKWIGSIFKDITKDKVFDAAVVVSLCFVNHGMRLNA